MKNKQSPLLLFLILPPLQDFSSEKTNFHLYQFFSNFLKYLSLNFLSFHPYNNFTVYLSGNSLLLNSSTSRFNFILYLFSTPSYHLTSALNLPSNSSTNFLAFSKFFSFFYVSLFTVNVMKHFEYQQFLFYFSDFILILFCFFF